MCTLSNCFRTKPLGGQKFTIQVDLDLEAESLDTVFYMTWSLNWASRKKWESSWPSTAWPQGA